MTKAQLIEAMKDMADDAPVVIDLTNTDHDALDLAYDDSVWAELSNVQTSGQTHNITDASGMIWLHTGPIVMG